MENVGPRCYNIAKKFLLLWPPDTTLSRGVHMLGKHRYNILKTSCIYWVGIKEITEWIGSDKLARYAILKLNSNTILQYSSRKCMTVRWSRKINNLLSFIVTKFVFIFHCNCILYYHVFFSIWHCVISMSVLSINWERPSWRSEVAGQQSRFSVVKIFCICIFFTLLIDYLYILSDKHNVIVVV